MLSKHRKGKSMKNYYEEVLDAVVEYIRDSIKENPIKDGNKAESKIYYMNGNDGTDFDWDCNNRTCEFFVFYDTEANMGYVKAYVTRGGDIEGYVWDTERPSDGVALKPRPLSSDERKACAMAEDFKDALYSLWDCSNTWDTPLRSL